MLIWSDTSYVFENLTRITQLAEQPALRMTQSVKIERIKSVYGIGEAQINCLVRRQTIQEISASNIVIRG